MGCAICGANVQELKVGKAPVSGYYCESVEESLNQPQIPLVFQVCSTCQLVKYRWVDDAIPILDKLYSSHFATYHYTNELTSYMDWFIKYLSDECSLTGDSQVLEIGCNSGRLLHLFKEALGCQVVGVEPSKNFRPIWRELGLEVHNDYFGPNILERLKPCNFNLIFFRHVFEHIPDLVGFFKSVTELAMEETVIAIEVPYLPTVISKNRIENISYSHLNYFSARSLAYLAEIFGFGIYKFELVETDGGSIIALLKKGHKTSQSILDDLSLNDLQKFIDRISFIRARMKDCLLNYEKPKIVGYGAGAKGQFLVHMLNLEDKLSFVVDDTTGLQGKFIPGTKLKIENPSQIETCGVEVVINLCPTHSQAIRDKVDSRYYFIDPINE